MWQSMLAAPRIEVHMPAKARADYLVGAYADIISDAGRLAAAIGKLKGLQSKETIEAWLALASEGNFPELARQLMELHYDPLYARSRKRREDKPEYVIELAGAGEEDFKSAATALLA